MFTHTLPSKSEIQREFFWNRNLKNQPYMEDAIMSKNY